MSLAYIGKGCGRRAFDKSPRSKWWCSIAKKHGITVEIVSEEMSEDEAHNLEIYMISQARGMGEKICNVSSGGEGSSGFPASTRKVVYCSNGKVFESTLAAAQWVSDSKNIRTCFSAIAAAASGKRYSSYGFSWSYSGPPEEYVEPSQRRRDAFSKHISCSNGMSFSSVTQATAWVVENVNPKASSGKISRAARSDRRTAYGFKWSYT